MPSIPIIMPQLGESIAEANIINFLVKPGDTVEADQDLIEVETNKATMTVTSPCRGRIEKFTAQLNESYAVGAVLGQIEATKEEAARLGLDVPAPAKTGDTDRISAPDANGGRNRVQPTVRGLPVPANAAGASYLSPRLKARMNELGLHAADLAGVAGSGAAGRVTVEDFERFIAHLEKQKITQASSMRVAVADAMRRSWTRPHCARRPAGLSRSAFCLSQSHPAQTRPGALRLARAGGGAGGKQRSRRPAGGK